VPDTADVFGKGEDAEVEVFSGRFLLGVRQTALRLSSEDGELLVRSYIGFFKKPVLCRTGFFAQWRENILCRHAVTQQKEGILCQYLQEQVLQSLHL
jgi:hypothetical protein